VLTLAAGTAAPRDVAQGFGGCEFASPIAWVSILLETSMGPISKNGRMSGQGNLVEAKAMLDTAGKAIAASQRMVFHFNMFCLFAFFIG
jgi:hypothetical protein